MKKITLILVLALTGLAVQAQGIQGSWMHSTTEDDKAINHVFLFSGDFFSWTAFYAADGAFIATKGGSYKLENNQLMLRYEFDTADTTNVGQTETRAFRQKGPTMVLGKSEVWKLEDAGATSPLQGPWLISGRMRDGEIKTRDTNRPRKTMKILTATRFQWIAYNTETKEFFGTGGGTYTAENGKYTENIGFFSRDNSRVGASLGFDFEVKEGDWHHSGKSSKGNPLYEVWTLRK